MPCTWSPCNLGVELAFPLTWLWPSCCCTGQRYVQTPVVCPITPCFCAVQYDGEAALQLSAFLRELAQTEDGIRGSRAKVDGWFKNWRETEGGEEYVSGDKGKGTLTSRTSGLNR